MKRQYPVIAYFACSLFTILNCEMLVTLRAASLLGPQREHFIYALHSVCVAAGVACFHFAQRFAHGKKLEKGLSAGLYPAALLALLLVAAANSPGAFLAYTTLLFLLAGWNTGLVSLQLYQLYRESQYVGRILAIASFLGISAHYALVWLAGGARILLLTIACAAAVCALGILYFCALQARLNPPPAQAAPPQKKADSTYLALLLTSGGIIAGISFLIGISDSIAAQRIPHSVTSEAFFYPLLFYVPGQVAACLLLDIREGRYLHLATIMSVITLIPVTLFLETPAEFYLHAGINYFIGGFFLAYIMTSIISIAHKATHPLFAICLPGMLYPLFCGVGGILSPLIGQSMNIFMILAGYSFIILLLMAAMNLSMKYRLDLQMTKLSPLSGERQNPPAINMLARKYRLTNREKELLPYLLSAMTANEIAAATYISVNTLKTHTRNILEKTGAASRRELRQRML